MAINYAPGLPHDKNGEVLENFPSPKKALAVYGYENATASSVISLTHDTTAVEIAAVGGAAVIRWIATSDTAASVVSAAGATANFDHVVPSGMVRQFVVPIESRGLGGQQSIVGVNRLNGLFQRIAIKSVGVASVMTSEF